MLQRLFFQLRYYRRPPWDTGISPPELVEFIQNHAPGRAIDLGCGTGTNVLTLARAGWQVTGVDFAPRAIRLAGAKIRAARLPAAVAVADVTRLRGINGPFDLALDIGCFHSLGQGGRMKYLTQLDRILAPQGSWLMYGFFRSEDEHAPPGLREAEIHALSARLDLLSRRDGLEKGTRPSAWFLFQKRALSLQI